MACGDRVQVTVTSWGVCWKWIFPYPCKKSSIQTRLHWQFTPSRTRFALFQKKFEGCCAGTLYEWSDGFTLFGNGNGPWISQTRERFLVDGATTALGNCPFGPPPIT